MVEPAVRAIAARVETLGRHVVPMGSRAPRCAIEPMIDDVASTIQPPLDPRLAYRRLTAQDPLRGVM